MVFYSARVPETYFIHFDNGNELVVANSSDL